MPLETGRQLGPYEIVSSLGAGGMGEVYEATDTRLGRTVAIKVLPEAFVADPERLARFEREARVLATLNHPKIAGIYDVGEETGTHFLVMELAAGETLDERIVHGPVPVGEALSIAVQITAGLEAAHARGIVHRDLKPANVAVDEEGEVKVLDFGLARALEPDPESQTVTELARSPTLTYRPTEAGVLLGTAAYMSPEQARGKAADERSDLWALGVVLWEMLTGRRLFGGDTVSDTLASVLKEEPDWTALPPETPPAARRLLRRCLTKDPAERLHHAADARLEIEDAAGESEHGAEPEERRRVRERDRRRSLVGVAALSLLTGLLGLLIGSRIGPGDESEEHRTVAHNARFAMAPSDRAQTRIGPGLAISPDASHLAFVGFDLEDETRRLYLRATEDLSARPLPGTEGALEPFFSWDGEWIAYFTPSDDVLWKIPVAGGTPTRIAEVQVVTGISASWGPDDSIVFGMWSRPLLTVPSSGGIPQPLTDLEKVGASGAAPAAAHLAPHHLPGGRHLLFTVVSAASGPSLSVLDLETEERRVLREGVGRAWYVDAGYLVYARGASLSAAPFDPETAEFLGDSAGLVGGVASYWLTGESFAAVARRGGLTYIERTELLPQRPLVRVDRQGEEESLDLPKRGYETVRVSEEGDLLALSTVELDQIDVWFSELDQPSLVHVSQGLAAVWGPAGSQLSFPKTPPSPGVYVADLVAGTDPERLLTLEDLEYGTIVYEWSDQGRYLVYGIYPYEIRIFDRETEVGSSFEKDAQHGVLSPDGEWIAYTSGGNVYAEPFPRGGRPRAVSVGGGRFPCWSPVGDEIFFWRGDEFVAARVRTESQFEILGIESLFSGPYRQGLFNSTRASDVAPDGQSFFMIRPDESPGASEAIVVLGDLSLPERL